jgi:hypothetical protein
MPRVRHVEDAPVPIRMTPELLEKIALVQKQLDLQTRSAAIRLILWAGIRVLEELTDDHP